MVIRKAKKNDISQIISLAAKYNLDYEGMEADDFWVATEGTQTVGICGLRKHPDCQELCSLGVEEAFRQKGLGSQLVKSLLQDTNGAIYLATVIPEFFAKLGFKKASTIPSSMIKKAEWCAGCNQDRCTIMLRKRE